MPKVVVKNGNVEEALKKFKKITADVKRDAKRHQYHLRKIIMRREKSKAAQKRRFKFYNQRNN